MTLEERLRATLQDPSRRPSPDLELRIMSTLPARKTGVGPVFRSSWVPLGAAAILAVVLVVGSTLALRVVPITAPASPDATTGAAATPRHSPVGSSVATYPDGIPSEIDGESVLRGDAITAKVTAAIDDKPFLVGGWATGQIGYRCLAMSQEDPPRPVLLACGAPALFLMDAPDSDVGHVVVAVPPASLPAPGMVALRVHVHDARATQCEPTARVACEAKLVLDAVVWTEPAP